MKIIIAGVGDVGFHLAKLLSIENHDINIIDKNPDRLKNASKQLDVGTIKGSSTSYAILQDAGVSEADLFIAVTSSEETNLATAIIAKHLGAKKTIARVSNTEFISKREEIRLNELGIDEVICPESLASKEIKRLLRASALTDTFDFDNGKLSLIGVLIREESKFLGKSMKQIGQMSGQSNFVTVAILRNNETIIPHGDTIFELNDHAYFIVQPDGVENVLTLSGNKKTGMRNIMILGGSRVGINAAKALSKNYHVKLIEKDEEKCNELAELLTDTMIINADGRELDVMLEENIDKMDVFIAVTGNTETNIISCLMAKNNGVKKTISLVENIDYIHLSQNIGVDTMINKKLIAANFTFRYIRQGQIVSLTSIHGVDAEILEFEVNENSRISEATLKELDFPASALIGGVVRKNVGYTTLGDFVFKPQDRVVVLARPECIKKVESFFK